MVVRKILETTLTAGQMSVTFSDSDISNSLLRIYTTDADIFPTSQSLSGNTLTVEFEAQSANIGVALEIVKQGLDIIDDLISSNEDKALSAKQGKVLKDIIDAFDIPENITDMNDVDVDNIQNNQVLAWSASTQKFINVNQSGGGSTVSITPTLLTGEKVADYSIDGVSGSLYAPASGGSDISYSTTERKIGSWIDGSDLYEKTIYENNVYMGNTSNTGIAHNVSNIGSVRWVELIQCNISDGRGLIDARNVYIGNIEYRQNFAISNTTVYSTSTDFGGSADRYWFIVIRYTKSS